MKEFLTAFSMCQSMFCAIPSPWHGWDEKQRDTMLLCLPLVGLEIGLIWWGAAMLCRWLDLPAPVQGVVMGLYPGLVTGYMHLDGFMDVTDAVKSWRSLERRREILKDSRVGSFAVIAVAMLLIAQTAFFASVEERTNLSVLIFVPVVSRCCSVLAVLALPPMTTSQYSNRRMSKKSIAAIGAVLALALAAGFLLCGKSAWALPAACLGFACALHRAYRSLEGMNGDIAGYSLTFAELSAAAVLALL